MGKLVSGLLGGGKQVTAPIQNFQPIGIQAGGFDLTKQGNNIVGGSTAQRLGLVGDLSGAFGRQAGELSALKARVAPGFSDIRSRLGASLAATRQARLSSIGDARQRALGDLRENLSRRRILGSSFGQDALSRGEAEFARQEQDVLADVGQREAELQAQTTLQELESTRQLIGEEFTAARGAVGVFLENLNLESAQAASLATGATQALSANARVQSELLQQQANNKQGLLTGLLGAGIGFAMGGPVGAAAGAGLGKGGF